MADTVELLREVVTATTASARANAEMAVAVSAVRDQVAAVVLRLDGIDGRMLALEAIEKARVEAEQERGRWLRELFTPRTVLVILAILASAVGVRVSLPAPLSVPSIVQEAP